MSFLLADESQCKEEVAESQENPSSGPGGGLVLLLALSLVLLLLCATAGLLYVYQTKQPGSSLGSLGAAKLRRQVVTRPVEAQEDLLTTNFLPSSPPPYAPPPPRYEVIWT